MLTFSSCESTYSYALKVLIAYDWKKHFKIDDMLISTFSVGQYMFGNILCLDMVDSTSCIYTSKDVITVAVMMSFVVSKIHVG